MGFFFRVDKAMTKFDGSQENPVRAPCTLYMFTYFHENLDADSAVAVSFLLLLHQNAHLRFLHYAALILCSAKITITIGVLGC